MEQSPAYSPAVCLRLINDFAEVQYQHCSLCAFFHGSDDRCEHQQISKTVARTATPFSDCTFYTAKSGASEDSSSLSSRSSTSTIKAKTQPSVSDFKLRSLRRTSSPQQISLRELHQQQAQVSQHEIRQQESEERLQQLYESQILSYLNSPYADLDPFEQ